MRRLKSLSSLWFMADWRRLSASTTVEQIRAVGASYPSTFGMTLVAVISLVFTSERSGGSIAVYVTGAYLVIVSAFTLMEWYRDRSRGWSIADPARRRRGLCIQAAVTALAWYSLLGAAGVQAVGDQRSIIDCIMVGVLSAGGLRYAPVVVASLSFIGAGLVGIIAYAVIVGLPPQVFAMLCIFTGLVLKWVVSQALLILDQQRSSRELLEAAVAREKSRAAIDRSELARARREQELRQEASAARATELRDISQHFQSSVLTLVAELTQRAQRGRDVAEAFGHLTVQSSKAAGRLLAHAKETSLESGELGQYAGNLNGSLERLRQRIGDQTQVSARVQSGFQANETAAALLAERAEKISRIITLIGDIAKRTRLLALNASIEAASAGEAGRGFTIVAQEVKSLAAQTRQATEEVTLQIKGMREAIEEVTSSFSIVRNDFGTIHLVTASLEDAMAGQRALIEGVGYRTSAAASLHATLDAEAATAAAGAGQASMLAADLNATAKEIVDRCNELLEGMRLFIHDLGLGKNSGLKKAA